MPESSANQLKKTAKHSAIYATGTILRRITGFVMLPIYTRYLTPADYGVVELLTMAIEIASILIGLRISQALFRYYIMEEDAQQKKVIVSTVMLSILVSSAIGVAILNITSESLSLLIFGTNKFQHELQIFSFTLMANAVAAVGLSYLRARQKPILFVAIGIISLVIQVILNIIFVVILEMHVTGVVYSALISSSVIGILLFIYVIGSVGLHYSWPIISKLVRFVTPLIVASLGAFYVAYADKYFLRIFGGLTEVGLYSLAGRVSSVLFTVFEAFYMSWGADRFEIVKKPNASAIFNQVFKFLSAGLFLVGACLILFADDFFRIMTDPAFYPAGSIVPILVFAVIIQVNTIFCNFGILLNERTRFIAEASWIKAVVASVGFIVLIPYIGLYGAAITLVLSNLLEFRWVYKHATNLYDMGIHWKPISFMFGVIILFLIVGGLMPNGEVSYFIIRLLLLLAIVITIYKFPIWQDEEKYLMASALKKIKKYSNWSK